MAGGQTAWADRKRPRFYCDLGALFLTDCFGVVLEVIAVAESEGVHMDPEFAEISADRYASGPNDSKSTSNPRQLLVVSRPVV